MNWLLLPEGSMKFAAVCRTSDSKVHEILGRIRREKAGSFQGSVTSDEFGEGRLWGTMTTLSTNFCIRFPSGDLHFTLHRVGDTHRLTFHGEWGTGELVSTVPAVEQCFTPKGTLALHLEPAE